MQLLELECGRAEQKGRREGKDFAGERRDSSYFFQTFRECGQEKGKKIHVYHMLDGGLICSVLFNYVSNSNRWTRWTHFADEGTETQRGEASSPECPTTGNWQRQDLSPDLSKPSA